jgi:hypothetical protein
MFVLLLGSVLLRAAFHLNLAEKHNFRDRK